MTGLLSSSGLRPYRQLRRWAVDACESAVAGGREALQLAVADRSGSVHVWPLDWARMRDDAQALDYCRVELAGRIRGLDAVAHALMVPGWIGADGVVWAQSPSEDAPPRVADQIILLSLACPEERVLLVGAVAPGPPRRVARWERTRMRPPAATALALRS